MLFCLSSVFNSLISIFRCFIPISLKGRDNFIIPNTRDYSENERYFVRSICYQSRTSDSNSMYVDISGYASLLSAFRAPAVESHTCCNFNSAPEVFCERSGSKECSANSESYKHLVKHFLTFLYKPRLITNVS